MKHKDDYDNTNNINIYNVILSNYKFVNNQTHNTNISMKRPWKR